MTEKWEYSHLQKENSRTLERLVRNALYLSDIDPIKALVGAKWWLDIYISKVVVLLFDN